MNLYTYNLIVIIIGLIFYVVSMKYWRKNKTKKEVESKVQIAIDEQKAYQIIIDTLEKAASGFVKTPYFKYYKD